jgi:hypothetical protein
VVHAPNIDPFAIASSPTAGGDFDLLNWPDEPPALDFSQIINELTGSQLPAAALPAQNLDTPSLPSSSCCADSHCCSRPGDSDEDRTSCSVAFELVRRYNSKGLNMVEICVRLWGGFRVGKKGREDCTVNNKVLFGVLDHISG